MIRRTPLLWQEFRSVALRGRGGGGRGGTAATSQSQQQQQASRNSEQQQRHPQHQGRSGGKQQYDPTVGKRSNGGGNHNNRSHSGGSKSGTSLRRERSNQTSHTAASHKTAAQSTQRLSEEDGALAALPLDQLMRELQQVGNLVQVERRGDLRDRLRAILRHVARSRIKHMSEDDLKKAYNFAFVTGSHKHALKLYFAKTDLVSGVKDSGFSLHAPAVEAAYLIASLESLTKLAEVGANEMVYHPLEIVTDVENCRILWRVACLAVEREFSEKIRRSHGISEEASENLSHLTRDDVETAARKVYSGILNYNMWIDGTDVSKANGGKKGDDGSRGGGDKDSISPSSSSETVAPILTPPSATLTEGAATGTPPPGVLLPFDEVWSQLKAYVRYSYQTDKGEMQVERYFKEKRIIYNSHLRVRAGPGSPMVLTGDKRAYFYVTLIKSCNEGVWHQQAQEYFDEYTSIGEKEVSPKPIVSYLSVLVKANEHKKVCEVAGHLLNSSISSSSSGTDMQLSPVLIANIGTSASETANTPLLKTAFEKLMTHPEPRLVRPMIIHSILKSMTRCPGSGIEEAFDRCMAEGWLQKGVHYSSLLEFKAQITIGTARHISNPLPIVTRVLQELDEAGDVYTANLVLDLADILARFESPLMVAVIQKYVSQQGGVMNLDPKNRLRIFDYIAKWAYARLDMLVDSEREWVVEWLTKNGGGGDGAAKWSEVKDIVSKIQSDLNPREESPIPSGVFDPKLFSLQSVKTKTKVFVTLQKEFPVHGISDEEIIRLKAPLRSPFEASLPSPESSTAASQHQQGTEEKAKAKVKKAGLVGGAGSKGVDLLNAAAWADASPMITQVPANFRLSLLSPEEGSAVFLENYLLDVLRDSQHTPTSTASRNSSSS